MAHKRKPTRQEKRRPKNRLSRVIVYGRWGGAASVFKQFITPFMKEHGLNPGSKKRTWGLGSDHNIFSIFSYAIDFPTYNGETIARALAAALGITTWRPNSYTSYYITVFKVKFRVQILWGSAINHGDHIHVGFRKV